MIKKCPFCKDFWLYINEYNRYKANCLCGCAQRNTNWHDTKEEVYEEWANATEDVVDLWQKEDTYLREELEKEKDNFIFFDKDKNEIPIDKITYSTDLIYSFKCSTEHACCLIAKLFFHDSTHDRIHDMFIFPYRFYTYSEECGKFISLSNLVE